MTTTFPPMITRDGSPASSLWSLEPGASHLNHGSFGGVPVRVLDEQANLRQRMESNPVRWFCEVPALIAEARVAVASQLGVALETVALIPNASAGASVVYQSLANRGPVNIMVTSHGYGAVVMGAERLARSTGGSLHTVDIPLEASADTVTQLVDDALSAHPTDLLVIDQITSATARAFPTTDLCSTAHAHHALVLVDGAHAPGVLEHPVETEADVWVGNLHKFWCAPRGAAVLVRNNPELDLYPLIDSWSSPDPFPARFDYQGTLDVTPWLCAPLAHQFLADEFGWEAIRRHSAQAMDVAVAQAAEVLAGMGVSDPVPDVGQPVGPMRLVRLPGDHAWTHDEVDALRVPFMDATGCIVSFTNVGKEGFMRLSAHAYTTHEDISVLVSSGIPALTTWTGSTPHERKNQ